MGLDMYLYAEQYIGRDHDKFAALAKLTKITPTSNSPSFRVCATIGYWRKANAIHAWFVKVVQDGVDECQRSYVSRDQLAELRKLCQEVLDTAETIPGDLPNVAAAKLPTQSGFFFGQTEYDDWYLQDLRDTVAIIDNALNNPALSGCEFYYRSSW